MSWKKVEIAWSCHSANFLFHNGGAVLVGRANLAVQRVAARDNNQRRWFRAAGLPHCHLCRDGQVDTKDVFGKSIAVLAR
jgi:hypothetical protein